MFKSVARILPAALAAGLIVAIPAAGTAQEEQVVAQVNGEPITRSDVEIAAADLLPQLSTIAADQRYRFLVQYLVERQLLAQAAVKAKIDQTEAYKKRREFYDTKALRDAYFKTKIEPLVTEKDAKAVYDAQTSQMKPQEEVRVRHILLKSEEDAKAILAELKEGADFVELAKAKSTGPSAANGGDLGYFTKETVVPEFAQVVFSMKPGQVSQPVRTNFGWHVLKVEDRRMQEAQPFDAIKTRMRNLLLRQKVAELATTLRKNAEIEYVDPEAKPLESPVAQPQTQEQKQ